MRLLTLFLALFSLFSVTVVSAPVPANAVPATVHGELRSGRAVAQDYTMTDLRRSMINDFTKDVTLLRTVLPKLSPAHQTQMRSSLIDYLSWFSNHCGINWVSSPDIDLPLRYQELIQRIPYIPDPDVYVILRKRNTVFEDFARYQKQDGIVL